MRLATRRAHLPVDPAAKRDVAVDLRLDRPLEDGQRGWLAQLLGGSAAMNPTQFHDLKAYLRATYEDVARLRALDVHARAHYPRIAQAFYERIREHAEAHAVIQDEAQMTRLQASLTRWIERFCTSERDDAYFAETAAIGNVHVRVGLPQRYVISALSLIHSALAEIAEASLGSDAKPTIAALGRAADLELAVMLETYHESFVQRLERVLSDERAQVGRRLERVERHAVHAVELAPYLVVGLDARGDIRLFNRCAERVTGLARDEATGQSFGDVLMVEDAFTQHRDAIEAALRGAISAPIELRCPLRTRAGQVRVIRWHIAHAPASTSSPSDPDDDLVAYAIGVDVTDSERLAERTRNSEKLAAVGTLAAGLAHEIRNPLNGAQLHLTFLERALAKTNASIESRDAVAVVGREIKRLSMLVTEFLDFARPQPLQRASVELGALLARARTILEADAAAAHVQLVLDVPSTPLTLSLDADKLLQVLLNLARNAIEALAPVGGGPVFLRVRRLPLHAIVEVEDQGPGLPNPSAPVFDAFFSTKANGTGLGLSIVHRIVSDHGGTIAVESVPGRTVFRVQLPLHSLG
ncbi:MAG: protoglobin domain-containing protein [Polyangiales bacterium]